MHGLMREGRRKPVLYSTTDERVGPKIAVQLVIASTSTQRVSAVCSPIHSHGCLPIKELLKKRTPIGSCKGAFQA